MMSVPKSLPQVEKPRKNVCDTDVCQHEADLILSAINNTVDPCQDFYGFVCGKWLLRNPIPDDQQSISSLHKSAERVTNDIGTILNTTIFKYKNQNATDKAIIFYKSCLREVNFTEKQRIVNKIITKKGITMWPSLPVELSPTETTPSRSCQDNDAVNRDSTVVHLAAFEEPDPKPGQENPPWAPAPAAVARSTDGLAPLPSGDETAESVSDEKDAMCCDRLETKHGLPSTSSGFDDPGFSTLKKSV
ncbi:neprilysin-2-like [Ixodes scapularis]